MTDMIALHTAILIATAIIIGLSTCAAIFQHRIEGHRSFTETF